MMCFILSSTLYDFPVKNPIRATKNFYTYPNYRYKTFPFSCFVAVILFRNKP